MVFAACSVVLQQGINCGRTRLFGHIGVLARPPPVLPVASLPPPRVRERATPHRRLHYPLFVRVDERPVEVEEDRGLATAANACSYALVGDALAPIDQTALAVGEKRMRIREFIENFIYDLINSLAKCLDEGMTLTRSCTREASCCHQLLFELYDARETRVPFTCSAPRQARAILLLRSRTIRWWWCWRW